MQKLILAVALLCIMYTWVLAFCFCLLHNICAFCVHSTDEIKILYPSSLVFTSKHPLLPPPPTPKEKVKINNVSWSQQASVHIDVETCF